jgi:hypothetical protein
MDGAVQGLAPLHPLTQKNEGNSTCPFNYILL